MKEMYKNAGILPEVYDFCDAVIKSLEDRFKAIDAVAEYNQMKVVMAMQAITDGIRLKRSMPISFIRKMRWSVPTLPAVPTH